MTKKSRTHYGLYTEYGVCIDLLIADGLTRFFSSKLEAMTYASTTRSYHYEVLNGKKQFAGYAVPK